MNFNVKQALNWTLKGAAMGVANVIPGVSGGTIALLTGIFERLINAIKNFDLKALKLFFSGRFKEFAKHIDLAFLIFVFLGIVIAIVSVARILEVLWVYYPVYVLAFFFGLVLASVLTVAKRIEKWNASVIILFVLGAGLALFISFLKPAAENDAIWYVGLCGVVAACSMILPGLSGSFVLILMGNYKLIWIDAVNHGRMDVLIATAVGAGLGILAFSRVLSWVFKNYRNQTIAVLTGFILGSLGVLWPWKNEITERFGDKVEVVGYDWFLPSINTEFYFAVALLVIGFVSILIMEKFAGKKA